MARDRMHVAQACATHIVFLAAEVIPLVKINFHGLEMRFPQRVGLALHWLFLLLDAGWPLMLNITNICPIAAKCKYYPHTDNESNHQTGIFRV